MLLSISGQCGHTKSHHDGQAACVTSQTAMPRAFVGIGRNSVPVPPDPLQIDHETQAVVLPLRAQTKSSAQFAYLAGEGPEGLGPVLRQMSVFLCVDELRGRGVYGLHMPMRER